MSNYFMGVEKFSLSEISSISDKIEMMHKEDMLIMKIKNLKPQEIECIKSVLRLRNLCFYERKGESLKVIFASIKRNEMH